MNTYYVELLDDIEASGVTMPAGYYKRERLMPYYISERASRVWCETETGNVWYAQPQRRVLEVDMVEFLWVKLKAKEIGDR